MQFFTELFFTLACVTLHIHGAFGRNRFYRPFEITTPPPDLPERPSWLAVPNCPPEIYLTDRLACYNSGRYMKSQNRLSSDGYLNSMKVQTRGMQANLELTKFTTFTKTQQGVKNVVFL